MYENGYLPPILTVDSVVFQLLDNELFILLIERSKEPFKGAHALPGGYNAAGETTTQALTRVLKLKAGIDAEDLRLIEQLHTFDTVARDPRGHAVSVAYMGLGTDIITQGSATTQSPEFFPVNNLPKLVYDHQKIIDYALERLASKITYTNAIFALLPRLFTISQMHNAYETILGRKLDRRNFRKKFLSLDLIEATGEHYLDGAHRPALLYKFKSQKLETLSTTLE